METVEGEITRLEAKHAKALSDLQDKHRSEMSALEDKRDSLMNTLGLRRRRGGGQTRRAQSGQRASRRDMQERERIILKQIAENDDHTPASLVHVVGVSYGNLYQQLKRLEKTGKLKMVEEKDRTLVRPA